MLLEQMSDEDFDLLLKRSFAIYKQLKPHLKTAISHATTLGSFSTQEYKRAMCEMPLLLELVYVDNK